MNLPRARLVFPALRWRRGSFAHERAKIDAALAAGVGGFILFGGTRAAVAALTRDLRARAGRPLLIGADLERGPGQQVRGLVELPPPAALGFLDDLECTYTAGVITGAQARAVGINWTFAPVCDLDIEPRNPIVQTRSFGADPERVGAQAAAWVRGCQEHGVLACVKHYPGHGRTTVDSHEVLPVVEAVSDALARDFAPFAAALSAGAGSVMTAHVAYPAWDASGAAATFSRPILGKLRDGLGFDGLIVTDAFIMAGATAAQAEGPAAVAAVSAGCDVLLYPNDWAAVVRSLEAAPVEQVDAAVARYEAALATWGGDSGDVLDDAEAGEQEGFADELGDRALHWLRGGEGPPRLGASLEVAVVDDDVGGPYTIPPRDVFHRTLTAGGARLTPGRRPGVSRVVLVYSEPRSWKGRAELGVRSLEQLARLAPGAALIVLFGHPRLVAQIPGAAPVLGAWHGQALLQRAAARRVMGISAAG